MVSQRPGIVVVSQDAERADQVTGSRARTHHALRRLALAGRTVRVRRDLLVLRDETGLSDALALELIDAIAVGVIFGYGGRIVSLELFDAPDSLLRLWHRLVRAHQRLLFLPGGLPRPGQPQLPDLAVHLPDGPVLVPDSAAVRRRAFVLPDLGRLRHLPDLQPRHRLVRRDQCLLYSARRLSRKPQLPDTSMHLPGRTELVRNPKSLHYHPVLLRNPQQLRNLPDLQRRNRLVHAHQLLLPTARAVPAARRA